MIYADMSFGYMTALAAVLTLAGIGLIVCAVFMVRLCKAAGLIRRMDDEYLEEDELVFHGWEDPDLMPIPVERKAEPAKKKVPIERIEL